MSRTRNAAVACVLTASAVLAFSAPASAGVYCDPRWVAGTSSDSADDVRLVQRLYVTNNTSSNTTATFTSTQSATTTYTVSASVTVEGKAAIFAKISGTLNGSVQKSMTATTGVSASGTVSPGRTLIGDYGTKRENAMMWTAYQYSNCNLGAKTYTNASAPYGTGWTLHY